MADSAQSTIIRNARILDGSGGESFQGDICLTDGSIAAIGRVEKDPGAIEIDAEGLAVAPGFIDTHTHFDCQIFWDPDLTPSCWHGVTTVVQGNCGFGIAPTRPDDRDNIMRTLENVEGMNLETLRAGISWDFETFPEYLNAVSERPKRLNVGMYIGHTPLRIYVMGFDAATSREATQDEVDSMASVLEVALQSGAIGFSSSQAPSHVGALGRPVPSRVAGRAEVEQLFKVAAASKSPLAQITYGPQFDLSDIARLSRDLQLRVTWGSLLTRLYGPPGVAMGMLNDASELGGDIWPQVSCREIVGQMTLENPYYFGRVPAFEEIFSLKGDPRLAKYADEGWRSRVKAQVGDYRPDFPRLTSVQETEIHHDIIGVPLSEVARDRGVEPFDLMIDLGLAEDLKTRFRTVSLNDNEEELTELLSDPRIVLGAHDAGAHVDHLCDACFPTHLLGYWVREKKAFSLEEAIWRLTGQPAALFGIEDRGHLAKGKKADVVLFDPEAVSPQVLERVYDLPAGGDRLIARSTGIHGVWVNGVKVFDENGDVEGAYPGVVVTH